MNKTIWQKEGIAPIEYCDIRRASEILGCNIDDLVHLGRVGAIELCILLENMPSSLVIKGYPRGIEIDENTVQGSFNAIEYKESNRLSFSHDDLLTTFKIEKENVATFRNFKGHSEHSILLLGMAKGLWALTYQDVNALSKKDKHTIKTLYPERHLDFQKDTGLYCVLHGNGLFHSDWGNRVNYGFEKMEVSIDNLILSRRTISKIHEAMIKGIPMPNFINGGIAGDYLTNHLARGDIELLELSDNAFLNEVNIDDCLYILGAVIHTLKNTSVKSKRWTQDSITAEITDKTESIRKRMIDEYFSLANKRFKSDG